MVDVLERELSEFKLIPLATVADALGCSKRSVEAHCKRHRVPLTELSRSHRGLLPFDFGLLLARSRQSARPAAGIEGAS